MISIVIPVRNGGVGLRRCLVAIRGQAIADEVEIVVVDSGSTDGSQELARSFGARVHEIPSEQFNHGATRNLGARMAAGEIVVFTVDDAVPIGERWLECLCAPLREPNDVAAAYSRQIAQPSAPPHQRFYIDFRFGPQARLQRASGPSELTVATTLFSNVSSAIRASILDEFPFPSDIVIAEDLEWCSRVLLAGHSVAYVPDSIVEHSHDYSLGELFKRYFDQGAAAERSFMAAERSSPGAVRGEGLRFVRSELSWMWNGGNRRRIPAALANEATRYLGFQVGAHNRFVPRALRARISRTSTYWETAQEDRPQSR